MTKKINLRGVCREKNPEKVWSPRVNKKPNLKFGVLKRVKNGLKWLKNDQKNMTKNCLSPKKNQMGGWGGGPRGVWPKTTLFPDFFSATFPKKV